MKAQWHKRACVLGLGESGEAAARLLLDEGARVFVLERDDTPTLRQRAAALETRGAQIQLGIPTASAHPSWWHEPFDLAVISPGIRSDSSLVREFQSRNIPIIPEIDLAASRCRCPILAITGTNGKSTLAKLCAESLAAAGRRVALAGNYGYALSRLVSQSATFDWIVLEVSSFQLEMARTFHPRIGVLLNIQPNHLDRHGTLEAYAQAKMRLFAHMEKGDIALLHEDEISRLSTLPSNGGPLVATFGLSEKADYRFGGGRVWLRQGRRLEPVRGTPRCMGKPSEPHGSSIGFENTLFAHPIMGLTAAAAVAALEASGEPPSAVARAARSFQPLPHRMQIVAEWRGVRFVDNSKATNLSALSAALQLSSDRVALIAGGILKEDNLLLPAPWLSRKVRLACLIGRDAPRLYAAWQKLVPCHICRSLEEAVRVAWAVRASVDTILLAPGGASFDQFHSFEERGRSFAAFANHIKQEEWKQ